MTLLVRTARVTYVGADRFDITRKSGGPAGAPFAPSWSILAPMIGRRRRGDELTDPLWEQYVADYTAEMRDSYRRNRPAWNRLFDWEELTLVCYCADPARCHRRILAGILAQLGAVDGGERR